MKFARNSYKICPNLVQISDEFHVNVRESLPRKILDSSFCPRWPSQSKHRMKLRGYHTPSPMIIIPADRQSTV